MIKITHIFKTYFPDTQGGLEEAIRQIGKYSVKNGYSVKVVSVSNNPIKTELDGIQVESFKRTFGNNSFPISFSLIRNFRRIIKEADIIHLHYPYPLTEILTLLSFTSKPVIVTFICDIFQRKIFRFLYYPFILLLFNKAKFIVPINENLYDSTLFLHRYKNKIRVINLWIDTERMNKLSNSLSEANDNIISNKYALFIGVLRWYKGLDILLDSAKNVKYQIIIIGKGPLYEHLNQRIITEKIENVKLLGFVEDEVMMHYLKNCSFLVLPSISPAEAFGQVLLEASFFSKPMVTTELGTGTSFVNKNNETGFVIEPRNSSALSDAMNNLFSNDELRLKMGTSANNRLKTIFTEDNQGPKYIELYSSLVKK